MRIAYFSDNFYPEVSGVSDAIITLGHELAERGHTIRFYAPKYTKRDFDHVRLPYGEPNYGPRTSIMRLPSFPYPSGTRQSRFVIPLGWSRQDIKNFAPDIMHTHSPFPVGIEALFMKRSLGVPLVGTHHTPITEFMRYSPLRGAFIAGLGLRYVAWYYNHCEFITSPSITIVNEMKEFGFRRPGRAMSNPLNVTDFHIMPNKEALKTKTGLKGFTLLYVGRLAVEKNIDLLLKAFAAFHKTTPESTLGLVGRGAAEDDMKKLAHKLGVEDAVRFFGFIEDRHTLAEIYNASDVFAIVSTAETQSLVAMQALACGVPVIAARAWGLPEYIHHGENGVLIEPGNLDELLDRIEELHKNPDLRKRLGARGRTFTEERSAPKIAETWEHMYEEAITHHAQRS